MVNLVTDPEEMMGHPLDAREALRFAREAQDEINRTPPGPEYKFIRPDDPEPGQPQGPRYKGYARRNGRSIILFDNYTRQGINVNVDRDTPIRKVVEPIIQQQYLDFVSGRFSDDVVWPRVRQRLLAMLLDPVTGLLLTKQSTKQFEVRRTLDPELIAIVDYRDIPERRGDTHPVYIIRLHWLIGDFNLVHYVYKCSVISDRIRASLYRSVARNQFDRLHRNPRVGPLNPNRFSISMGSPHTWWIQDTFLQRQFVLYDYFAWDMAFDIGRWYEQTSSVVNYTEEEFNDAQGWYSQPAPPDPGANTLDSSSPQPIGNVVGGDREYNIDEPDEYSDSEDLSGGNGDTVVAVPSYIAPPYLLSSLLT
ncbi:hypothetical protein FRC00_007771 [Tulasnella sp. 408]|nr:hypothetical protein FRC00_007771 [Tulasnella sp. 408]